MRRYTYLLFVLGMALLVFFSCNDEELIKGRTTVEEGIPTMARLSFVPQIRQQIDTRASGQESLVKDLYVFIFNEAGDKETARYFPQSEIVEASEGTIRMAVTTGRRYIYGVANLSTNDFQITPEELDRIETRDDLSKMTMRLQNNSIRFLGGYEFMSGFYGNRESAEDAPVCVIREDGSIDVADNSGSGTSKLWLKRLQSRITFDVGLSEAEERLVTSFTLDSFSVINVPQQSALIESAAALTQSTYFSARQQTIFNDGKNNFTFYMLENKLEAKRTITGYEEREAKEKRDDDVQNWTNAPDNGTYVVLKGRYKGKAIKYTGPDDNRTQILNPDGTPATYDVNADVAYYIHLGYVNDVASDFKSKRNKDYTYHVKVFGVDRIVLEVETDDPTDRADGDVYYMDGENIFEVDAHYASRVMHFTRKQLGEEGLQFKVMVNSNRTNGFENKDTDWLTFVRNPEGETRPVCYPGKDHQKLLSADAFVADLEKFKKAGTSPDDVIYYTCFIREYYDTDNNWRDYVNQNDRVAQIICNTHVGNGSHTVDAAYIIRQKSIQTFYDCDRVNSAWGLEWINETTEKKTIASRVGSSEPIEVGLPYYNGRVRGTDADDWYNGRWNMIQEIGTNAFWYENNFVPKNNEPAYRNYQQELRYAYAACMQRNRDENGDGKITDDEIKWYLPAIYQYLDISVGANVLPERVQLYTTDDYNTRFYENKQYYWMFKHFVSNTSRMVFWGEEGGPYGQFGESGDGKISANQSADNGRRQFRCVRNLGTGSSKSLTSASDRPADFAGYQGQIVDLSNMNPKALRTDFYGEGELGRHSERDYLSRPFTKFKVASKNLANYSYTAAQGGAYSRCEGGYFQKGTGLGDYKRSQNYYSRNNNRQRYFKVDAGLGDYLAFTARVKSGSYYYYNTGNPAVGRYKRNGSAFTLATTATSDLSGYTWVRSDRSDYNYGTSLPNFYTWKNGDYKLGANNRGYLYYYVGAGQGSYAYCGHSDADYHYVGEGNGNYNYAASGGAADYRWCAQNLQADRYYKSVCSEYAEEPDGSDRGKWRLPNLRELLLIDSRVGIKKLMSRTYYSFFLKDFTENGYTQNENGTLSGYSIYSPAGNSRQGYASNGSLVYLVNPGTDSFKVRCVRDVR